VKSPMERAAARPNVVAAQRLAEAADEAYENAKRTGATREEVAALESVMKKLVERYSDLYEEAFAAESRAD